MRLDKKLYLDIRQIIKEKRRDEKITIRLFEEMKRENHYLFLQTVCN